MSTVTVDLTTRQITVTVGSGAAATKDSIGLGNVDNTSDADKPVSTAQQVEFDKLSNRGKVVTVSGNKTLSLSDAYSFQNVTASATITVPTNAAVAFVIGTQIDFFQAGSGEITFTPANGVTIIGSPLATALEGDAATLKKIDLNTWSLII